MDDARRGRLPRRGAERDFLIENTAGALVVGEVGPGDAAQYTALGPLAGAWTVVGVGDYLGEGHDQVLLKGTSGAIDVGDVQNGQLHLTQVGAVGSEWAFH